jgi:hypothetical protein
LEDENDSMETEEIKDSSNPKMTVFTGSDDEGESFSPKPNIVFNRQKLPILKSNVPLTVSSNELFEIFRSISGK